MQMDAKEKLFPRPLSEAIRTALADMPVVCILGPRQSGKTTLAQQLTAKREFISLDEQPLRQTAGRDPDGFINGLPDHVTIDEVQRVPELLPAIKLSVDRDRRPGRFLLTGSANLLFLPTVMESLAGRMETLTLLPLTEAEKERRPGRFLLDLIGGTIKPEIREDHGQNFGADLARRLVAGGYPAALSESSDRNRRWHRAYLQGLIIRDVQEIARIRDVEKLEQLLTLLARREGQLLDVSKLARAANLHRTTLEHYLAVLARLFLIRKLPAWRPGETARLVKAAKVHLCDSGLMATLAKLGTHDWQHQRTRMGHLLESFVIQQLITQAGWTDPELEFWHYRDKDQVEVDLVMTLGDSIWGFEIKSSSSINAKDGQGLARLARRCGKRFQRGIVFYAGASTLPMPGKRMLTVPLSELWKR